MLGGNEDQCRIVPWKMKFKTSCNGSRFSPCFNFSVEVISYLCITVMRLGQADILISFCNSLQIRLSVNFKIVLEKSNHCKLILLFERQWAGRIINTLDKMLSCILSVFTFGVQTPPRLTLSSFHPYRIK